jgi:NAD+ synthase
MQLTKEALKIDPAQIATRIKRFIIDYVQKTKTKGIVIGVSGGIDSTTTAALASSALGPNKITAINMPEKETYNPTDIRHAQMVAKKYGFKLETIEITPILNIYYKTIPTFNPNHTLSKANLKARTRMTILYYHANKQNKIVCGSSDKSETMMGYFTKWGDVAADISPLMDLYKTQVRQLATHIGIPKEIIAKPPSPQLWPGQLAEKELGIKYEVLDLILLGLENLILPEEIAQQLKLPTKQVQSIKETWLNREHKRRSPLTLKLEYRTIGTDFRLPYTLPY